MRNEIKKQLPKRREETAQRAVLREPRHFARELFFYFVTHQHSCLKPNGRAGPKKTDSHTEHERVQ